MTFTYDWKEDRVHFAYTGEEGAVSLTAEKIDSYWGTCAYAHRPAREGEEVTVGECIYSPNCHTTFIPDDRSKVPVYQWERHDNDPAYVERVLREWYKEFVSA